MGENPAVGAHVMVRWSDGGMYGATILGHQQGYCLVRWDSGAQTAWIRPQMILALPQAPPAPAAASMGPRPARVVQPADGSAPTALVFEPVNDGPGRGRAFFIMFGYTSNSEKDRSMRAREIEHLGDDVAALRAAGYRVIVDLHGTKEKLIAALVCRHPESGGAETVGVLWSGRGTEDGAIETHNCGLVRPSDVPAEVAVRGNMRLFVMSACHTGRHSDAWRSALGPQALVVGWGAPVTIERAVDFFTPDELNSKEMDDLLARRLGAPRVADDGPLVELQALERALPVPPTPTLVSAASPEAPPSSNAMRYEDLVDEAGKILGVTVDKEEDRSRTLTIRRSTGGRDRLVRLFPVGEDVRFYALSRVGVYSDALDLARGLREFDEATYTRMYIAKPDSEGRERITVEACVVRRGVDPTMLADILQEVADKAGRLQDIFFGCDDR